MTIIAVVFHVYFIGAIPILYPIFSERRDYPTMLDCDNAGQRLKHIGNMSGLQTVWGCVPRKSL